MHDCYALRKVPLDFTWSGTLQVDDLNAANFILRLIHAKQKETSVEADVILAPRRLVASNKKAVDLLVNLTNLYQLKLLKRCREF